MINNPLTQLKEFSFCLLAGAVAAVIYEIFYIIRFVFGFHKLIEFFLDIIYIVISGLIFFFTVYLLNGGEIEYYHPAGFLLALIAVDFPLRIVMRKAGTATLKILRKFKFFNKIKKILKT